MATAVKTKKAVSDKTLLDLLDHALKDIYYAEKKIYRSLPEMIKAAEHDELKTGLSEHREETAGQIASLEKIFALLNQKPKAVRCEAIDGILEEGDGLLEDFGKTKTGDAAIIFSCQAVEHYEITRYGSMHAWAEELGMKEAASLIASILEQEKAADKKLSKIAIARINHAASDD